ncbi:MAG: mannosyltransferase family protein, partial [Actinomycetota bacterium]
VLVLGTRAVFLAVAWLAARLAGTGDGFVDMWTRWDAFHFTQIARFGYTGPGTDAHATAFFPAFPLSERALGTPLGIDPALAGMIVATAATLVACYYLYRLAEEDYGPGTGRRAVLYLLLFPTAVFLVAPYSEALFLAGAIPAFYYARRGRWLLVALPAALAMGSRTAGVFLLVGLLAEFVRARDWSARTIRNALAAALVALVPLAAYAGWLARVKDDPLYFLVDQREGWNREFTGPIESFTNTLRPALSSAGEISLNFLITWRVELLAAALGLFFLGWAIRRREWGYAAFIGSLLAVLMTSSYYLSIPRMLVSLWPIPLLLAQWNREHLIRDMALLFVMSAISLTGAVVFTRGFWFF